MKCSNAASVSSPGGGRGRFRMPHHALRRRTINAKTTAAGPSHQPSSPAARPSSRCHRHPSSSCSPWN